MLFAAHRDTELARRHGGCRGFLALQLSLGLALVLLGVSAFPCRANRREGILTAFKHCQEFLIILILRIGHWCFRDLLVVQMLIVDVHEILHVVLVEKPLGGVALPHVHRLGLLRGFAALPGIDRAHLDRYACHVSHTNT